MAGKDEEDFLSEDNDPSTTGDNSDTLSELHNYVPDT